MPLAESLPQYHKTFYKSVLGLHTSSPSLTIGTKNVWKDMKPLTAWQILLVSIHFMVYAFSAISGGNTTGHKN